MNKRFALIFNVLLVFVVSNYYPHEIYTYSLKNAPLDTLKHDLLIAKNDMERCSALLQLVFQEKNNKENEKYIDDLLLTSKNNLKRSNLKLREKNIFKSYLATALEKLGLLADIKGEQKFAIEYFNDALKLRREIDHKAGIANVLNSLGNILIRTGKFKESLKYFNEALIEFRKIDDIAGVARSYQSIGNMYLDFGDYKKALEMFNESLTIFEKLEDNDGIARSLNSLGIIYYSQKEKSKALEYLGKSLEIREKSGNKTDLAFSLMNVGTMYLDLNQVQKAFDIFKRSLTIFEQMNHKKGIAMSLNYIANSYYKFGEPDIVGSKELSLEIGQKKAVPILKRSLKISEETDNKRGILSSLGHLGAVHIKMKKFDEALTYALRTMRESKKLGYVDYIKKSANQLAYIYKNKGNYKLALQNQELFIQYSDSFINESNRQASIKSQLKYEYEKQAAADSVAHAKESEIKNAEIAKQTTEIKAKRKQQYVLFGGFGLVIIFTGFMYNRFKVTQKQKLIIESQKEIVEEQKKLVEVKQKEILDSIQYARKIQMAQIPSEKRLENTIKRLKK